MRVVCPGSFDPFTLGHLDIIARAARLFDEVIVAVGDNFSKNYLFTRDERMAMAREATAAIAGVRVAPMDGLLADFCKDQDARAVVKGVRFAADFDLELAMSYFNAALGDVETLVMPASSAWGMVSSTLVRDIARHGGDVTPFVPGVVAEQLNRKLAPSPKENSHG